MRRLTTSVLFRSWAAGTALYVAAAFVAPGPLLIAIAASCMITAAALAMAIWGPSALIELREGGIKGQNILLLGIGGVCIYLFWFGVVIIAARLLGRPPWLSNGVVSGYLVFGIAASMLAFLISNEIWEPEEGLKRPRAPKTWWFVVAVIAAGTLGYVFGNSGP